MPDIAISDSDKEISVQSDKEIRFNEGLFVSFVAVIDKIRDSIHGTHFSFIKIDDGGTTHDCILQTKEDRSINQKINFSDNQVLYAIDTGNSWNSEEWSLIDSVTSICADLVKKFGVNKITCEWK